MGPSDLKQWQHQWWSRVCKIKDSDFTVPCCTSHCFARLIFRNNIYVGRQNICKYVEQMVSMYIPISENQFDWFKGVDMEATVRNHIRQMLQNIKSQYISKNCSTNCSKKNNLSYRIQTSVPKFFLHTKTKSRKQQNTTRKTQLKRYTENTSLFNIYQRFYWPGSYALRGVIDCNICLQMGAPLFLLAFSAASLDPIKIVVPEESLITFNCYIALLKASRLIKWMRTFQFYYCHKTFIH